MVMLVWAIVLGLCAAEYVHHEDYMSGDFFSKWDFISADDPTHGFVDYVTAERAVQENLVKTTDNGIFIGVDNHSQVPFGSRGRASVRLESIQRYNDGLFIISLEHAPTGCGSWPAFWMFGEDKDNVWPEWGEFDIMEWIHDEESVSTTLHTKANCTQKKLIPRKHMKAVWNKGKWQSVEAYDCYVHADGQWTNQGCSQRGMDGSIGSGFNAGGGGTYAAEWDPIRGHMSVWIWHAGYEPADVISKTPNPELWGQPDFYFDLKDDCHPNHFKNMKLVFDITFCGDLGEPTYKFHCGRKHFHGRKSADAGPDAAHGGRGRKYKTCVDLVRNEFSAFDETYWSVQSLDVYRRADAPVVGLQQARQDGREATDARQCRSEYTNQLQQRVKELESILFRKEAELKELYTVLNQAEIQDLPPGHGRSSVTV